MSIEGNLLIAQAGGPTAVINASLKGVIEEAKKYSFIKGIYGARFGIEGVLNENFIDLGRQPQLVIDKLPYTPASALGSCRRKLVEADYPRILDVLKKYNIRYFFYNGGNDSMDTCSKISALAGSYEMRVIGIPKTIDNDLEHTDHCPGFGSAARYAAVSTMELAKDVEALPIHVCVMELMGRNAGWITASASLARKKETDGPHLIYLPERPFIEEQFLEDIIHWRKKAGGVLVVVSEGLRDDNGRVISDSGIVDGFGHKVPDAFVCHCDMAAYFLIQRLTMRGIKVPEDVSIISFDNTLLSESCTPALTSVNISTREIAEKSFQLLVERINNPHMSTQRIYTASTIIERDSVRNIKNRKKSS